VDVFTRRDDAALPPVKIWAQRVRVIHVDAGPPAPVRKEDLLPFIPEFAERVVDLASRNAQPYDVAHANFFMSGIVADTLEQATGTPFVITFHALGRVRRQHQGAADGFPEERELIEERLAARAAAVIAECPQDALDLERHYHVSPARLAIIPCGVDLHRFHPVPRLRARQVLGLGSNERILVQIGRMVPRKGIDDVIRAVGRLRRDQSLHSRLLVVGGDGDEEDESGASATELRRLRAIAARERVSDAVTFVGRRGGDVLRYYYSAADAFVSTPWYEPFGITPLEAMACGTPVIGSAVGGIKYTVVDGETGFLVPPRDPDAIAASAARLLRDDALRGRMASNGAARVRERFQWHDVAASIDALYDRVLRSAAQTPDVDDETRVAVRAASSGARATRAGPAELEA
jgi:glycosyltransferase involved in cell wall biosynthesis